MGSKRRRARKCGWRILKEMPRLRALHNYLRMYRKRTGLTQTEMAILLGCKHRSKVSRYERGARMPALQTLIAFELVFGAPIKALFAGTYEKIGEELRARARRLSKQLDAKPYSPKMKQKLDALVDIISPSRIRDAA